jgi:ABC-type multidrug transport system fused ATPase/permease subunit
MSGKSMLNSPYTAVWGVWIAMCACTENITKAIYTRATTTPSYIEYLPPSPFSPSFRLHLPYQADCAFHDHTREADKLALLSEVTELESGLFSAPVDISRLVGEVLPSLLLMFRSSSLLAFTVCGISPLLSWLSQIAAAKLATTQRLKHRADAARTTLDGMLLSTHLRTTRACATEQEELGRYAAHLRWQRELERRVSLAQVTADCADLLAMGGRMTGLVIMANLVRTKVRVNTSLFQSFVVWYRLRFTRT